jgi:hypothetical protein
MMHGPGKWKRFADHDKWQRRRSAIFAFLKTHSAGEAADQFHLSRQRIYQLIAKQKSNPEFGRGAK